MEQVPERFRSVVPGRLRRGSGARFRREVPERGSGEVRERGSGEVPERGSGFEVLERFRGGHGARFWRRFGAVPERGLAPGFRSSSGARFRKRKTTRDC